MSRPPLPLGTWGTIGTYIAHKDANGKPDRYRATANYRDFDGRTRRVERSGKTAAAAANNLRIAMKERTTVASRGAILTASHRFDAAADIWLERLAVMVREERRSPGTLSTYRSALDRHVRPALGQLRLGELTTPLVDAFIGRMREDVSASTAKLCRSIVSGIMGIAVRKGAVSANPVREVERIEATSKSPPRALTAAERRAWFARLRADKVAVRRDLPDLSEFMIATGARIGETLALLWSEVDLEEGTVEITSTIVRATGVGLVRKSTKSSAGQRVLALPTWAVALLRRRFMAGARLDQPVFPDALGGFRDPNNTLAALREARGTDEALGWITSHNLRKTTATILDDAGLSARAVADQLGHSRPSMTQDVYLARRLINRRAADALESAMDDD